MKNPKPLPDDSDDIINDGKTDFSGYFAGIDIGSLTGKTVVIDSNGNIISTAIIKVKRNPILTASIVFKKALEEAGLGERDIKFCVGTGYGREKIPYINKSLSEISCHGKGAFVLNKRIRTVIDVGGQDCKIIIIDGRGDLVDFIMNEKCAAGTGRFLEIMAELLNLSLDDLGKISLKSRRGIVLTSTCSIYAQAEVLKSLRKGIKKEDIAAGINRAMAHRVYQMARKLPLTPEYTITGGVAKNRGVVKFLEDILGVRFIKLGLDAQLIGAFGAAVFAREFYIRTLLKKKWKGRDIDGRL